jgi:predicted nucleic acid-binding protein
MILVDTSVWIAHFRKGGSSLTELLSEALVLVHPFVVGELACGNLRNRARICMRLTGRAAPRSAEQIPWVADIKNNVGATRGGCRAGRVTPACRFLLLQGAPP